MNHLSQEQLLMVYYGEAEGEHLNECPTCRAEFAALETALGEVTRHLEVEERSEDYGARVWQRIAPRLERPQRESFWAGLLAPRRWAMVGAMAMLLVAAFLAGHYTRPAAPTASNRVRERILLVAVGDHLERSQMVLMEIANSQAQGELDISAEQQRAQELVASNRLYRQTAARAGDAGVASVLDELERTLLEIAHSPSKVSGSEFESLRTGAEGVLFKVRVIDSQIREKADQRSL